MIRPLLAAAIGTVSGALGYAPMIERARDTALPYPELSALGLMIVLTVAVMAFVLTCRGPRGQAGHYHAPARTKRERDATGRFTATEPVRGSGPWHRAG